MENQENQIMPSRYLNAFVYDLIHFIARNSPDMKNLSIFGFVVSDYVDVSASINNKFDDIEYDPANIDTDFFEFVNSIGSKKGHISKLYAYLQKILREFLANAKKPCALDEANQSASKELDEFICSGNIDLSNCPMFFDVDISRAPYIEMATVGDLLLELARFAMWIYEKRTKDLPSLFNTIADKLHVESDDLLIETQYVESTELSKPAKSPTSAPTTQRRPWYKRLFCCK